MPTQCVSVMRVPVVWSYRLSYLQLFQRCREGNRSLSFEYRILQLSETDDPTRHRRWWTRCQS